MPQTRNFITTQPPGMICLFTANTPPEGWLKCNGAAISRTAYADLFAIIGTTYGSGNGSTTFNVPDLRGEFLRGFDDGRGVDSGRTFASIQAMQNGHDHGFGIYNSNNGLWPYRSSPASYNNDSNASTYIGLNSLFVNGSSMGDPATLYWSTTGNRYVSGENKPRNYSFLYCIKY